MHRGKLGYNRIEFFMLKCVSVWVGTECVWLKRELAGQHME
jgi:hypothetical protein